MDNFSVKKRAAKGVFWISIEMIFVQANSFFVFVAIAHFVTPRDFGLIALSYVVIQSIQQIILDNVSAAVNRMRSPRDDDYSTVFWVVILISIFSFGVLLTIANQLEKVFTAPGLAPVLRAMSVIVLVMGLSRTHESWLIRHFRFQALAFRSVLGAFIGGFAGLWLAVRGFGVVALVGQQVVTAFLSSILLWLTCPWRPRFEISKSVFSDITRYLRVASPNSTMYAINQNCDTILVSFFFGVGYGGLFNIAKRIRLVLQLVAAGPVKGIALPSLAEAREDPERLRKTVLRSLMAICLVCAPIFFGCASVSSEAISVLFGPRWIAASPIVAILSIGGFAFVVNSYNDQVLIILNKQIFSFYISIFSFLVIILIFYYAKNIDGNFRAAPFVVPYVFTIPFYFFLVCKWTGIPCMNLFHAILPGVSSAAVMAVFIFFSKYWFYGIQPIISLVCICCFGAVVYFSLIFVIWRQAANIGADIVRHMIQH